MLEDPGVWGKLQRFQGRSYTGQGSKRWEPGNAQVTSVTLAGS